MFILHKFSNHIATIVQFYNILQLLYIYWCLNFQCSFCHSMFHFLELYNSKVIQWTKFQLKVEGAVVFSENRLPSASLYSLITSGTAYHLRIPYENIINYHIKPLITQLIFWKEVNLIWRIILFYFKIVLHLGKHFININYTLNYHYLMNNEYFQHL